MSVKFLHIADCHLDTPFKTIANHNPNLVKQMVSATRKSFQTLMDVAIDHHVDFVCIVGDSFNSQEPSVSSQLFFQKQLERLHEAQIPVYLVFGNHDYNQGQLHVTFPENVHVFPQHVTTYTLKTRTQQSVHVTGFSYHTRHVSERMIQQYPNRLVGDMHIGLLHGSLDNQSGDYAPFTLNELTSKQYDYWALGHIHKREIIQQNPPIVYSGSIQGLNRNETGDKGGYLVTLEKGTPAKMEPINTATVLWHQLTIDVDSTMRLSDYAQHLNQHLTALRATHYHLCSIIIRWSQNHPDFLSQIDLAQYAEWVPDYVVIFRLTHETKAPKANWLLDEKQRVVLQNIETHGLNRDVHEQALELLWKNPMITTHFSDLREDDAFYREITQQAFTHMQQEGTL